MLLYPLGIHKDPDLRKDREAESISQLTKAEKCILRTTCSMSSVSPHFLMGRIHKRVLESLFQNCVISNWSCPKTQGERGWNCETVFVCAKAVHREKQGMLQILSFIRVGDIHCLVGVEYSNF